MSDLSRLEALARAATPGPWTVEDADGAELDGPRFPGNGETCVFANKDCEWHPIADCSCNHTCRVSDQQEANAAFIAAMNPKVVLAMIAELRERRLR